MNAEIVWNAQMVAVVLGCSIPLVVIVGGLTLKAFEIKSDNELKQAMVQRGMSAEEIERVLAAKGSAAKNRESAAV